MELAQLQQHWHALGEQDPYWAILSDPDKRGGGWGVDEFFATGREVVGHLLVQAEERGRPVLRRAALDFGCGAGRLTQALAGQFDHATGVDIAPSMLELARRHNRHGSRCDYRWNDARHLGQFRTGRFDFVLSLLVLQHMQPAYAARYVAELTRVLAPGGLLVFQALTAWRGPGTAHSYHTPEPGPLRLALRRVKRFVKRGLGLPVVAPLAGPPTIEVYPLPRAAVERAVTRGGGRVHSADEVIAAGPHWLSHLYWVVKD